MLRHEPQLERQRTGHGREQIDTERDAEHRERDLLNDEPRKDRREGRSRDQRHEHQHHHQRADIRRQKPVQSDPDGRQHRSERDLSGGKRRTQDRQPCDRREPGLERVQHNPADDRLSRDRPDLLEQLPDPIPDRHPSTSSTNNASATPASHAAIRPTRSSVRLGPSTLVSSACINYMIASGTPRARPDLDRSPGR